MVDSRDEPIDEQCTAVQIETGRMAEGTLQINDAVGGWLRGGRSERRAYRDIYVDRSNWGRDLAEVLSRVKGHVVRCFHRMCRALML